MARKTTAQLKTGRDFGDLLDSIHNNSDVQRITATGAFTVSRDTSFVALAADGGKTVTMPAAIKGRKLRFFWEVEQATNDLVATCQGSDVFAGNIFTSVEGNGAGDGFICLKDAGSPLKHDVVAPFGPGLVAKDGCLCLACLGEKGLQSGSIKGIKGINHGLGCCQVRCRLFSNILLR